MRMEWAGRPADVREIGKGPAVILLHGYPLDGAMWSGVARALAARFRVLKPDLPGRGETPGAGAGRIEGYADFVETLVGALPAPVGLAGFSMGGYVSFGSCERRPEPGSRARARRHARRGGRRGGKSETRRGHRGRARRRRREDRRRDAGQAALPSCRVRTRPRRPRAADHLASEAGDRGGGPRRHAGPAGFDRSLPEIGIPTLVLVGEHDVLTPPADSEAMAAAIPGARLVTVPGAGHLTPMERPGAVSAALGDFFAAALSRGLGGPQGPRLAA